MSNYKDAGEFISKSDYLKLTESYRRSDNFLKAENNEKLLAVSFGREKIDSLLAQDGCEGVRIYFGEEEIKGKKQNRLIIVGMDKKGNDLKKKHHKILDRGWPCPDNCPDLDR